MTLPADAKPVPFDPAYYVTPAGEIWSLKRGTPRKLRPWTHRAGYQRVHVGGCKRYLHRLVLLAHGFDIPPGMETRHLDGDPANNQLDNLAIGTTAENAADKIRHGRAAKKLDAEKVRAIRAASGSQRAIARRFGIAQGTVSVIRRRVRWAHVPEEPVQLSFEYGQQNIMPREASR